MCIYYSTLAIHGEQTLTHYGKNMYSAAMEVKKITCIYIVISDGLRQRYI